MTKKNLYREVGKLRATGALVLMLALSTLPSTFTHTVNAQTPAKALVQTPAKANTSPTGKSKGGQKEGITIHGHWTIDVRNPDGTLVSHRDFENALTGETILTRLLSRTITAGSWAIILESSNTSLSPFEYNGSPISGLICESTKSDFTESGSVFKNLNVRLADDWEAIILVGRATAGRAGTIDKVSTAHAGCLPTVAPSSCPSTSGSFAQFTQKSLTAPLNVVKDQIIQVTVSISFSSPSTPTTPQ